MSSQYRNNHYVPVWYQKRFLPPEQQNKELFYLDLKPGTFIDPRGIIHTRDALRRLGLKYCFAENDLYTTHFGSEESTEIEQHFFGAIDRNGHRAVGHYANFSHPWDGTDAFQDMIMYMSTQKLRTPKGLGWLSNEVISTDRHQVLREMKRLRQLYCAIWAECVWLIADASRSDTKLIISDHPMTVYNRRCGPRSSWCRGYNDPDIRLHGTHTLFPLSLDKILILTNLSWMRNPYQSEIGLRPNPYPFRGAIFKINDIQTLRHLSEQEVREINFIIKSRALRYIGAAKEEWLYPERHVTKSDWFRYGHGYLLMPDPRSVTYSRQIIIGNRNGTASAFDEYGHRPWEEGYRGRDQGVGDDWNTFHRFQGEFARLFGPYRRGRAFSAVSLDNERDSYEFHQDHLSLEEEYHRKRKKNKKKKK
ncbi:MAG: hypothetical protein A3C38_02055 [Planctomycetes bacterium RIFCSPHIGHO2_02_FULL_50_42]|nr:MAG: hypothetical protein A2060_01120 [Planctomycetes bacterium GWA2_50_13]OHB90178.1 MAG: hypothetical protein A3C38_02055 [Planctomycetes bacterium RIFCSPHIGHO2_02_FULL_50_42]OHB94808.1 MAG: hypothetical protein A3I59_01670 [Planctomycetes bacterium RIFCSPLOWO2_02_FULL_50_16]OHC03367.1 MAG: hypothetical protein A3G17_05130 [Planctomycetes bacterium RIFCSPLOWO2_12_FULL_50_35]